MRHSYFQLCGYALLVALVAACDSEGSTVTGPMEKPIVALPLSVSGLPLNSGGLLVEVTSPGIMEDFTVTSSGPAIVKLLATRDTLRMLVRGDLRDGSLGTIGTRSPAVPMELRVLQAALNKAGGYKLLDPSTLSLKLGS